MDKGLPSSRRVAGPDDDAVSARLAAIEARLDEIIRRLDVLKNLVAMLDRVQPNRPQCTGNK